MEKVARCTNYLFYVIIYTKYVIFKSNCVLKLFLYIHFRVFYLLVISFTIYATLKDVFSNSQSDSDQKEDENAENQTENEEKENENVEKNESSGNDFS